MKENQRKSDVLDSNMDVLGDGSHHSIDKITNNEQKEPGSPPKYWEPNGSYSPNGEKYGIAAKVKRSPGWVKKRIEEFFLEIPSEEHFRFKKWCQGQTKKTFFILLMSSLHYRL